MKKFLLIQILRQGLSGNYTLYLISKAGRNAKEAVPKASSKAPEKLLCLKKEARLKSHSYHSPLSNHISIDKNVKMM